MTEQRGQAVSNFVSNSALPTKREHKYMLGVKIPQAYNCVLRTTYRDNIAFTRRSYKTREAHNLALNVKYPGIRELYIYMSTEI